MDARVESVIYVMRQRLAGELSVSKLCKHVNLSSARLRQLFKRETGQSPIQYLTELRMKRACDLLRDTFLSIKEVTLQSGMRDVSHFVRDFKAKYGATPSEFRAELRIRK